MDDLELDRHVREIWKSIAYLQELERDPAFPLVFGRRLTQAIQDLSKGGSELGDLHNDLMRAIQQYPRE